MRGRGNAYDQVDHSDEENDGEEKTGERKAKTKAVKAMNRKVRVSGTSS